MHLFVEAEMLTVERNGGVDIMDDIADLNSGHSVFFLSSLRRNTKLRSSTSPIYADSHHTSDTRRCRFIAHTADSSALGAGSHVRIRELMFIIGPQWIV